MARSRNCGVKNENREMDEYRVPANKDVDFNVTTMDFNVIIRENNLTIDNGEYLNKYPDVLKPGAEIPAYDGGRRKEGSIEK